MLSKGMWRSSSKQSRCLHLQSPANISTCSRNLHLRPSSNRLHCRLILSPTIRSHQNPLPRTPLNTFSTTPHPSKKATKSTRIRGHSPTEATVAGTTDSPSTDNPSENDPYDFSTLESGIAKAVERLKDALGKLRAGGRFNPEIIERLKVQLKAGEGRQGEKVKIETVDVGDLAQVVPKGGRSVVVLVGDEDVSPFFPPFTGLLCECADVRFRYDLARQTHLRGNPGLEPVPHTSTGQGEPFTTERAHPTTHSRVTRTGPSHGQESVGGCGPGRPDRKGRLPEEATEAGGGQEGPAG